MMKNNAGHPIVELARQALQSTANEAGRYALDQIYIHFFLMPDLNQGAALDVMRFHYKLWTDRASKGRDRDALPAMQAAITTLAKQVKGAQDQTARPQ